MSRSLTPALALRGDRPGLGRSVLALLAAALVLLGSWAVLIGGVVLVVRALT
jgi:hypothetical protein